MLIESESFVRCNGETQLVSCQLRRLQSGFGEIQGRKANIDMGIECLWSTSLTIGQSGKLTRITKNKFNLETGSVAAIEHLWVNVQVD